MFVHREKTHRNERLVHQGLLSQSRDSKVLRPWSSPSELQSGITSSPSLLNLNVLNSYLDNAQTHLLTTNRSQKAEKSTKRVRFDESSFHTNMVRVYLKTVHLDPQVMDHKSWSMTHGHSHGPWSFTSVLKYWIVKDRHNSKSKGQISVSFREFISFILCGEIELDDFENFENFEFHANSGRWKTSKASPARLSKNISLPMSPTFNDIFRLVFNTCFSLV